MIELLAHSLASITPTPLISPLLAAAQSQELVPDDLRASTVEGTLTTLVPAFSPAALTWLGSLVILLLMFRIRPLISWRNLDGLALVTALTGIFYQQDLGATTTWPLALLSGVTFYWLLRAGFIFFGSRTGAADVLPRSPLVILFAAGLLITVSGIAQSTPSPSAQAGERYARALLDTGRIDGATLHESRGTSPLVGIATMPGVLAAERLQPTDPGARDEAEVVAAQTQAVIERATPTWASPQRLTQLLLFIVVLFAIMTIGATLHSAEFGLTLGALVMVFPGLLAATPEMRSVLGDPSLMLLVALLSWGLAFTLLGNVGGLLGPLFVCVAGLINPGAWLLLLMIVPSLVRRGWLAFAGLLGVAGGVVACAALLITTVSPALPRADRALDFIGPHETFVVRAAGTELAVDAEPISASETTGLFWAKRFFTEQLLARDTTSLAEVEGVVAPPGLAPSALRFTQLRGATPAVEQRLADLYTQSLQSQPTIVRLAASGRTLLEGNWLLPDASLPARSSWHSLRANLPQMSEGQFNWVRRGAKILALLLAIAVAVQLMTREVTQTRMVGAWGLISTGVLLAGPTAGAASWLLLLPAIAAMLAVHSARPSTQPRVNVTSPDRALQSS